MYGWMNVASLLLGLAAWILPIAAICGKKNRAGLSFALCSAALVFQVFYTRHLVAIRDWSALEDTQGAVCFAAGVLLAVTVLLNGIAAAVKRRTL